MGIMEDMANKQKIAKLLRYQSTHNYSQDATNNHMCSFAEYIKRMKEGQKDIYFLGGESLKDIYSNPILAKILARGYEVLMLDETIDEFVF
jgi:HSP90 family molecular chaperone